MAKKINLSEKNASELTDLLREKREELRGARFAAASRTGGNQKTIRADIARILTELTKRSRTESVA